MRIGLLDVNVLVALFDPDHVHHDAAHSWLAAHRHQGWATCPLTENGLVRVLSHSAYRPLPLTPAETVARLAEFRASGDHSFWADDVTLCDSGLFVRRLPIGSRQITDVYLLALAARHEGRLVTFDRSIPLSAVAAARPEHLAVVEA